MLKSGHLWCIELCLSRLLFWIVYQSRDYHCWSLVFFILVSYNSTKVSTGYSAIFLLHFVCHEYTAVKYVSVIYFCSAEFQNLFKFRPFFVQILAIFWSKFQILVCAFRPEFSESLPKFRISPISPRSGKNRKPKTETLAQATTATATTRWGLGHGSDTKCRP
jgi:hypothetical protein